MLYWDPKYEVGIQVVDEQHKELFELVEALALAVEGNEEMDCGFLIARLEVYSLYHFTSEEQLMHKYEYPELESHMHEHHKFRMRILALKDHCLESNHKQARLELLEYLENWLVTHILEMDRKYIPYLKPHRN